MKKISTLKGMLFSVLAFFALTTGSNAFLNGVYVEVGSSAVGVEAGGSTNDAQGAITTGTVGKTAVTGTYGLGYVFLPAVCNRFVNLLVETKLVERLPALGRVGLS